MGRPRTAGPRNDVRSTQKMESSQRHAEDDTIEYDGARAGGFSNRGIESGGGLVKGDAKAEARSLAARASSRKQPRPPRNPARDPRGRRRVPVRTLLVPFVLALLAYLPTLGHSFVWDDVNFIVDNPASHRISDLGRTLIRGYGWVPSGAAGPDASLYYRPAVTSANTVTWALSGGRPALFHFHNLLTHAAGAALLALIAIWLGLGTGAALLAGVFFALHPVSSEAVAWISGRTDVFAGFFALASLALLSGWRAGAISRWPAWSRPAALALALLLAFGSKESAAPLLVLVPLLLLGSGPRVRSELDGTAALGGPADHRSAAIGSDFRAAWWAAGAGFGIYLVLRLAALGSGAFGGGTILPDRGGLGERLLLAGNLLLTYLLRLVVPWPLAVEPPPSLADGSGPTLLGILGLLVLAAAGFLWIVWMRRRASTALVLGLGLFLVGLLPVLQVIPTGEIYGERFLYLPSAGLFLLLAAVLDPWLRRSGARVWIVLALAGIPWLVVLQLRLPDWKDEIALFSSAVEARPNSARALANLGSAQMKLGLAAEAEGNLTEAVRLDPKDPWKQAQLGSLLVNSGRAEEGTRHLEAAWADGVRSKILRKNLGIGWTRTGRYDEAAQILREALTLDPRDASLHDALAMAERKQGRMDEAVQHLRRAVEMEPERRAFWLNLVGTLVEGGRLEEAREVGRGFLQRFPTAAEAEAIRSLVRGGP